MSLRKKVPLFILLFLSGTLLLIYLSLPRLSRFLVSEWLTEQGFYNVHFVLEHPTTKELTLRQLHLEHKDPEKQLTLASDLIRLEFDLKQMLFQAQFKRLVVPTASVTVVFEETEPANTETASLPDLSTLLPSLWLRQLPGDEVRIGELKVSLDYPKTLPDWTLNGALLIEQQQLYSRLMFFREQQSLGWADLELTAKDHLHLRFLQDNTPFIVVDGFFSQQQSITFDSTLVTNIGELAGWLTMLDPQLTLPKGLNGSVTLSGMTEFPNYALPSPDLLLQTIHLQQTINAQLSAKQIADLRGDLNLLIEGDIQLQEGRLALSASNKSHIELHQAKWQKQPLPESVLMLTSPLQLSSPFNPNKAYQWSIQPLSFNLSLAPLSMEGIKLSSQPIQFSLSSVDLAQDSYKGKVKIPSFKVSSEKKQWPEAELALAFSYRKKIVDTKIELNALTLPISLSGRGRYQPNNRTGQFNWTLKQVDLPSVLPKLRPLLALPKELSVQSGWLNHKGVITMKPKRWNATLSNQISQLDAQWKALAFRQVEWQSESQLNSAGRLSDQGSIRIDHLDSGVLFSKLATSYEYLQSAKETQIKITELQTRSLGGLISVEGFTTNPLKPEIETSVTLDKLSLAALLELEQQPGLTGTGLLSGQFPIRYDQQGIQVSQGKLAALPPGGEIRFQANEGVRQAASVNVGLETALAALENFQYEELSIGLNYTPDGVALMKTRLKGNNPDWNQGRQVDFSINIEENIPKLIKTLQLTDKLTEQLEKRYHPTGS